MPRFFLRGLLLFALVFAALVLLVLAVRDEAERSGGAAGAPSAGGAAAAAPRATAEGLARSIGTPGLAEHLRALQRIASEHGGTRAAGTPGERASAAYVAERLRAAGYRVSVRRFRVRAASQRHRSRTVVAEAGPRDGRRVVMAGGHLDSVPAGPGLNDNGSGVAALLEIAEELSGRTLPRGVSVRFAFWGAEEIGLVGSRRYVDGLKTAERRRIAAYVNLDMVGSPGAQPAVYDSGNRIEATLRRHLGANAPQRRLGGSSDHAPFASAGVPTGGVFTGLDDCYHERCDTLSNVDEAVLTESARAAGAGLVDLAGR